MHPQDSYLLELLIEHQWLTGEEAALCCEGITHDLGGRDLEKAVFGSLLRSARFEINELLGFIADCEGIAWAGDDKTPGVKDPARVSRMLTADQARKYGVVPIDFDDRQVAFSCTYPCDFEELEVLAHMLERDVDVLLVSPQSWSGLFQHVYSEPAELEAIDRNGIESFSLFTPLDVLKTAGNQQFTVPSVDQGNISRYVDWVVAEAIRRRASDIHFEPMEKEFRIRCRVDGVLQPLDRPAKPLQGSILSRLKLMSHLDIAEKRLPQDGRFHLELDSKGYDFRVSTVPSTHGEGMVVRILDKERLSIGLPQLGMLDDHQLQFEKIITSPDGIFLVTGPTGSGKSTTLYAALNHINDPSVKIITVEDPVEYHIEGINQVQVRNEVNMTFSAALRSMLRQAPNIIMVGEIRDRETAEIAINASLTGHMVFSTLHTNDAPSAITRLIEMGAKPFLVSAALRAVMAQRLVRRIPEAHRIGYDIAEWQIEALGCEFEFVRGKQFFRAGVSRQEYHGRLGIFEMFAVDESLREVVYRNPTLTDIRKHLTENGFRNMRYDGVKKALMGETSIEEVLSVTPMDESMTLATTGCF